ASVPLATSVWPALKASRNASRARRSATGSPEKITGRASLPKIPTSALVSCARSAVTNASVASSLEAKRLGCTGCGFAAGAAACAGEVSLDGVGAGACAVARAPPHTTATTEMNSAPKIRTLIAGLLLVHHRHHRRDHPPGGSRRHPARGELPPRPDPGRPAPCGHGIAREPVRWRGPPC